MIINIDLHSSDLEVVIGLLEQQVDFATDLASHYEEEDEDGVEHVEDANQCQRLIGYLNTCMLNAEGRVFPDFSDN
jgi:hypothetical protein